MPACGVHSGVIIIIAIFESRVKINNPIVVQKTHADQISFVHMVDYQKDNEP
jgi:hypothetical protein